MKQQRNIQLQIQFIGPVFASKALHAEQKTQLATLTGFILPPVLHYEAAKVKVKQGKNGASDNDAIPPLSGYSMLLALYVALCAQTLGCAKGECLAVDDNARTHARLVNLYSRIGFTPKYYVGDRGFADLPDLIAWGACGTRCVKFCLIALCCATNRTSLHCIVCFVFNWGPFHSVVMQSQRLLSWDHLVTARICSS